MWQKLAKEINKTADKLDDSGDGCEWMNPNTWVNESLFDFWQFQDVLAWGYFAHGQKPSGNKGQ